jgi:hypothetical protein
VWGFENVMLSRLIGDKPAALDLLASIFFVLLSFLVFAPELVLGLKIVDMDLYRQVVPVTAWYGATVREGGDFLWSPGLLGGFPLAFSQYGFFFPLDWILARVLDPDRAMALNLAIHLPLAGIATYFYARSIGLSRLPALLAGVGYQLSTTSLELSISGYILRTLFLLPTLLLSGELTIQRGSRWSLLAAVGVGASLLTGTAYIVAIMVLNAGLYVLVRGIWLWRKKLQERAVLLLGSMGGAVILGVGLSAVRVLPTLVVSGVSVRAKGLPFDVAAGNSTAPATAIAGYLIPLTRMENVPGGWPPGYVGPVILALAVIALLRWRRESLTGVFGCLLAFNLLAFLGSNSPLFGLLHQTPIFADFRTPNRFTVAAAFFLSILGAQALGRESVAWTWDRRARRALKVAAWLATCLVGAAILAGFLWTYGSGPFSAIRVFAEGHGLGSMHPLRPRMILALTAIPATVWLLYMRATGRVARTAFRIFAVGGTAFLLLTVGVAMLQFESPDSSPPATARFLETDHSLFRAMSFWPTISYYNYLSYFSHGDPKKDERSTPQGREFRYRFMRETLAPNFALEFGLESIDGYDVLQSTRQAIAMGYLGSDKAEDVYSEPGASMPGLTYDWTDRVPLFRAFNVKYILTNLELWQHADMYRLAFTSPIPMLDPRMMTNVYVYEVIGTLPRAYLVPDSVVVKGETEALDGIMSGQLDPSRVVALEEPAPPSLPEPRLDPEQSTVGMTVNDNSRLTLQVRSTGSGYLVINDAFFPGWRAWVDGTEAPIYVANGWVRAIPIQSSGNHTVSLTYVPPLYQEGRWVSLGSLLLLCTIGVVSSRLPRRA